MRRAIEFLLDLVFPRLCVGCGSEGSYLCESCVRGIKRRKAQECPECEKPSKLGEYCLKCRPGKNLDGIIAGTDFENEILKHAMHLFKYESVKSLASPLSALFPGTGIESICRNGSAVLVPVPLHKSKLRKRGYSQTELLAEELGRNLKIEVKAGMLSKSKRTAPQMELGKKERLVNLSNAFRCKEPSSVTGKTILLVDDICTTGSTLEECAREIRRHRPGKIWGVTIGRGK